MISYYQFISANEGSNICCVTRSKKYRPLTRVVRDKSADVAVTFSDRPNMVAVVPGNCMYSMLHPCALRSESKVQTVQESPY